MRMVHKIGFDFIMLHYTEIGQNEKNQISIQRKNERILPKKPLRLPKVFELYAKKNISHEIQTVDEKRMVKV